MDKKLKNESGLTEKLFVSLAIFTSFSFLILYGIIAYYNRFAIDDFYFWNAAQKFGPVEATIQEYYIHCSRWTSVFLNHFVLSFYQAPANFFGFQLFGLLFLIYASFSFLKEIISAEKPMHVWLYSVLFVNTLFLGTFNIGEIWFWHCASTTYLWSFGFLMLGISKILSPKATSGTYLILAFSFIYLGGTSEPLCILCLGILLIMCVLARKTRYRNKLILAFLLLAGSFILSNMGEGTQDRKLSYAAANGLTVLKMDVLAAYLYLKTGGLKIIFLFFSAFLFAPLLKMKRNVLIQSISTWSYISLFIVGLFTILAFVLIFHFPVAYTMHDAGPDRITLPITLLCLFIFVFLMSSKTNSFKMPYIALLLMLCGNGYSVFSQYPILLNYSKKFDQRIEYVKLHQHDAEIILEPLPESGILTSAELSENSYHWKNNHFKTALHFKGAIRVKSKN